MSCTRTRAAAFAAGASLGVVDALRCAVIAALLWGGLAWAQTAPSATAPVMVVAGQHRGFTNDKLFLRQDHGKEWTFGVAIPGDNERKWQKDFATLSRITVAYVPGAAGALPVATAISHAADSDKK